MKAQRYTMVLIADGEEQKKDGNYLKKRMTQAAADKANDKLRAAADAAGIGPALAQRWERKGGPSILNKEETKHQKPARKTRTAKPVRAKQTDAEAKEMNDAYGKEVIPSEPVVTSPITRAQKQKAGKDAFGGRIGTRMSKINMEVINAGAKGILVTAIAENLGEPKGIVGAQLGWLFLHKKGLLTRTAEDDTFRYVATV